MGAGLLTGAFTPERAANLGQGDWRSRSGDFTGDGLTRNLALVDGLRPVAERLGVSTRRGRGGVDPGLPGGERRDRRRPQPAAGGRLAGRRGTGPGDKDLTEIAAAVTSSGAGAGPARPA